MSASLPSALYSEHRGWPHGPGCGQLGVEHASPAEQGHAPAGPHCAFHALQGGGEPGERADLEGSRLSPALIPH